MASLFWMVILEEMKHRRSKRFQCFSFKSHTKWLYSEPEICDKRSLLRETKYHRAKKIVNHKNLRAALFCDRFDSNNCRLRAAVPFLFSFHFLLSFLFHCFFVAFASLLWFASLTGKCARRRSSRTAAAHSQRQKKGKMNEKMTKRKSE